MLRFVLRRLGFGIFTMWAISVLTFLIIQLPPGDFASVYLARLGESGGATPETVARIRSDFGLDEPMVVQYLKWLGQVLQGNFGMSLDLNRPVSDVVGGRLGLTMVVSVAAITLTWLIAIPIGVFSAVRRYSFGDYLFTFVGFLGLAIPNFLLALGLMYVSFTYFGWSVGGLYSPEYETAAWSAGKVIDLVQHLIIPSIVIGAAGTAHLQRVMRANLLDELGKPYVVTARAKGLTERRLVAKYPMRVALNPLASSVGFLFPQIVSGGIIVSIVLSLPTVGPTLLSALRAQDMFLAGAIILLVGVMTVIGTLVSDLVLMWLDPRIRSAG
jgi:peptide/nickel transport system permease protein